MTLPRSYEKCACSTEPQVVKLAKGVFKFILSTGDLDCEGDSIDPRGWKLERFRKNPVVLLGHDASKPIARARKVTVENGALVAEIVFPPKGADELADEVRGRVESGLLTGASVGFRMLEWTARQDGGRDISSSELIEASLVAIPCNRETLRVAAMKAATTKPELQAMVDAAMRQAVAKAAPKRVSREIAVKAVRNQCRASFRDEALKFVCEHAGILDVDGVVPQAETNLEFRKAFGQIMSTAQTEADALAATIVEKIQQRA